LELEPHPDGLIFFELAVLTRWLLGGLLISVVALLLVAGAVVRHVRRQRHVQAEEISGLEEDAEALDLDRDSPKIDPEGKP
jgi:hypothetical protein